jgi:bifunctional DNase/RNase
VSPTHCSPASAACFASSAEPNVQIMTSTLLTVPAAQSLPILDVAVVNADGSRPPFFHASITVKQDGSEIEIDSRSSDAIAVAVRAQVPIYAADAVIEESAIEFEGDEVNEEEIVDEFKRFLDKVSAEDFAGAEGEEEETL